MFQIKELKKIYTPNKQNEVNAIDGISLTFNDNGMTFLLGKSGSGKSTLLNLLGGLDDYTEGEIIINGKSTKNFTQKDFDEYRNESVGFVFQEYNLLNDFTVGKNLSLALELKGKTATAEEIDNALKAVDLVGYAKRKPSELSGGQKQRVAVARALIKNPDIIFADEPTGNLDSTTGGQLFELLKDISKEKLVIVVSHDKESAEKYADRIIELADGKVISDVVNNVFDIKKDDNEETQNIKKKKHLSIKNLFIMGLKNLKVRYMRMTITLLLFAFALSLFGVGFGAYRIDEEKLSTEAYMDNNIKVATLAFSRKQSAVNLYQITKEIMTDEEVKIVYDKFSADYKLKSIYFRNYESGYYIQQIYISSQFPPYYSNCNIISGFASFSESEYNNFYLSLYAGEYPTTVNEVAITYYQFECFQKSGYLNNGSNSISEITTPATLLGKIITIDYKDYEIVGIIDTGLDKEFYNVIKEPQVLDANMLEVKEYSDKHSALTSELDYSLHKTIFVSQSFLDQPFEVKTGFQYSYNDNIQTKYGTACEYNEKTAADDSIVMAEGKTSLERDEIIVSKEDLLKVAYSLGFVENIGISSEYNNAFYKSIIDEEELTVGIITDKTYIDSTYYESKEKLYTIVGFWDGEAMLMNSDYIREVAEADSTVKAIAVAFDGTEENYRRMIEFSYDGSYNKYFTYGLHSVLYEDLCNMIYEAETLTMIGLYASLFFGFFAILMTLNFFTISVKDKNKEIGILRALGASGKEVFSIFYVESLIVSLFAFAISIIFTFVICRVLETYLLSTALSYKIFNLSFLTFLAMFAVSIFVATTGSMLPILKVAKKKPVEIIRN